MVGVDLRSLGGCRARGGSECISESCALVREWVLVTRGGYTVVLSAEFLGRGGCALGGVVFTGPAVLTCAHVLAPGGGSIFPPRCSGTAYSYGTLWQ